MVVSVVTGATSRGENGFSNQKAICLLSLLLPCAAGILEWMLGAPLRWHFSVFCEPLLPSLPLQPSLCLALENCVLSLHACQMKQTIFCSLLERWPYQSELPRGLSQQTCYIGLAPISTHEKAVHAYTFSLKLNYLMSGATVVNLVKDRCCSLMKGSSCESCSLPLNREMLQGLPCPPTESIDDDMMGAS